VIRQSAKRNLSSLSALGISLLPKIGCPICWGAHVGVVSSALFSYGVVSRHVVSLTAIALGINLLVTAREAVRCGQYRALALAIVACALILLGKSVLHAELPIYVGGSLLAGTSVWHNWAGSRKSKTLQGLCSRTNSSFCHGAPVVSGDPLRAQLRAG
jgi:hypothetical protein